MDHQHTIVVEKSKREKPQSLKYKTFEIIRKNFALAGITPKLVHQSYPFNGTILFGFLMICSVICCSSVFLICDAETFSQYTQAIYTASIATIILLSLLIIIFKVEKLFKYINGNDDIVNSSKLERWTLESQIHFKFFTVC